MPDGRRYEDDRMELVTEADGLAELCRRLAGSESFAFDAEFVGEHAYDAQLCLLQVAHADRVWLVDPMDGLDTTPFWELVGDEGVEKVVHAGGEDLGIAYQFTGRVPRRVFDVQVAAGLVAGDYPLSLQRLVRATLGVRLHKTQTLTDWRRRPLTEAQISYAVDDVIHLPGVRSVLNERLSSSGRLAWATEEFAGFENPDRYGCTDRDLLWRIRGVGALSRSGLAVAAELANEREKLAQEFNRPPRVLLKDYLLVEIAKHAWSTPSELKDLRGVNLSNRAAERLAEAVRRGLATPRDRQPRAPRSTVDSPEETAVIKLISTVLYDFCRKEGISSQLLATKKDVRALVLSRTRPKEFSDAGPLTRGWRHEAAGNVVDDLLSGRRRVGIVSTASGLELTVE